MKVKSAVTNVWFKLGYLVANGICQQYNNVYLSFFIKEMQSSMNMFNQSKDLPDLSDWFAKNISGSLGKKKTTTKTAAKKITGGPRRR